VTDVGAGRSLWRRQRGVSLRLRSTE